MIEFLAYQACADDALAFSVASIVFGVAWGLAIVFLAICLD